MLVASRAPAAPTSATAVTAAAVAQARLVETLRHTGAIADDLPIVHVAHICALMIDRRAVHVIDIVQVVPRASATGGARRIALVTPGGKPLRLLPYASERPLECRGDRLIVDGSLDPDSNGRQGNVIRFTAGGATASVADVEPAVLWPLAAGQRQR